MNRLLRNVMDKIKWNYLLAFGGNTLAVRSLGVTVGKDCRIYTRLFGGEPWLFRSVITWLLGRMSSL